MRSACVCGAIAPAFRLPHRRFARVVAPNRIASVHRLGRIGEWACCGPNVRVYAATRWPALSRRAGGAHPKSLTGQASTLRDDTTCQLVVGSSLSSQGASNPAGAIFLLLYTVRVFRTVLRLRATKVQQRSSPLEVTPLRKDCSVVLNPELQ